LNIYVPSETREIKKALLRFKLEAFRAYSKGNSAGGGTEVTSKSGGSSSSTVSDGGFSTVASTYDAELGGSSSMSTSSDGYHNHGIVHGTGLVQTDGGASWFSDRYTSHSHSIPSHIHGFWFGAPPHSHDINIPSHRHDVDIPSHTHSINYGIYTSTTATGVTVKINGTDRTSALGGSFSSSQNGINIAQYLITGQWNTIELGSTRLGRIDATVFIQALMGT
jgi:hypothetical protein